MTDECREAWYKRYGHYPCRLSENAWSMFCAGWEEARRSPDARSDALEEAAKVCEMERIEEIGPGDSSYNLAIKHCADELRAIAKSERIQHALKDRAPDARVELARLYAIRWHGQQARKYTGEPYWKHCESVAFIVSTVPHDEDMLCAAWLHDVLEDTHAEWRDVKTFFGVEVADLVQQLTDVSRPCDGNRATRKAIDREHLAQASPKAKTVKLADLLDNTRSIIEHDPKFARVYLEEKRLLLPYLKSGDPALWDMANAIARAEMGRG